MKQIFTILLLLSLFMSFSSKAQTDTDRFFKDLIEAKGIPAISVAFIKEGKVIYSNALGIRATDTKKPVDTQTVFSAASLSKQVFAYTVMKLVEKGEFDLDKPLHEYLEYKDLEHDERYKRITGRMALSHSTGMPNWRSGQLKLRFDPGAQFQYSGEGFVYLMKVIEHLQQKEINEVAKAQVFEPLGMYNSSFVWEDRFEENFAAPHDFLDSAVPKSRYTRGNTAYSLHTTAEDYAKLLLAVVNANDMKRETIDQMFTEQVKLADVDDLHWGLGWGIQQTKKGKAVWQWGDNGTYKAFTVTYPGQKTGMVFFTNSEKGLRIVPDVIKLFFDDECPAFVWADYSLEDRPHEALLRSILEDGYDKGIAGYLNEDKSHHDTEIINQGRMNWVADRLARQRRFDDAKKAYMSNIKAYDSFNAYYNYARACLRNGDQEEARSYFEKALEKSPKSKKTKTVLAQLEPDKIDANVTFRLSQFSLRYARLITLAGDFNDWNSMSHPFVKQNGEWICKLKIAPGKYHYKIVVDGAWTIDPNNPAAELDDDENVNSVLVVEKE